MYRVQHIFFSFFLLFSHLPVFSQPFEKGGTINRKDNLAPITESGICYYPFERVLLQADALKMYAKSNGFDTRYAFIVNMGMRSNTKRFFIVNLRSMCVENAGLVTHGKGDEKEYTGTGNTPTVRAATAHHWGSMQSENPTRVFLGWRLN